MCHDELDFGPVEQMSSDLDSSLPTSSRDEVWSTKDRSSSCEMEDKLSFFETASGAFLESNLADRNLD